MLDKLRYFWEYADCRHKFGFAWFLLLLLVCVGLAFFVSPVPLIVYGSILGIVLTVFSLIAVTEYFCGY